MYGHENSQYDRTPGPGSRKKCLSWHLYTNLVFMSRIFYGFL